MEEPEQKQPPEETPGFVSVKLPLGQPTSILLKDVSLYVLAIPLATPKETALGIMFNELCELRGLYVRIAQMAQQKPGIIRAGAGALNDIRKKLMS